jgi:small subunit ribosomal protein S20
VVHEIGRNSAGFDQNSSRHSPLRWYDEPSPHVRVFSRQMPNIKQQKRRVQTAARQRLENSRYRSTAKTLFKRLEQAVADGDKERAADEHRRLVELLDRASSRRAIHPNKAARKKSQAARVLAG